MGWLADNSGRGGAAFLHESSPGWSRLRSGERRAGKPSDHL